ncbi:MAG: ferredoxin, partial [Gammaproteobacteria bacterium]|nr:ferredoxin [Gammaproteobacteria bacterium]
QSEVSQMVEQRGGVDLMPESECQPNNKYLLPRPRRSANVEQTKPLETASSDGGLMSWVSRLLENG